MKVRSFVIIIISSLLICAAFCVSVGCYHDMKVMKVYNARMQESIEAMQKKQEQQASDIRQVKSDTEIMLRLAVDNIYLEEEKHRD